ncbi:hypothetical protein [Horticoccus sp. 23ND18S-11]|uniref:hypothetical protein n=1 Tax=Horticoccus sp. 23ND18S-11 TaxID=3391832 RepID=UPI0039C95231
MKRFRLGLCLLACALVGRGEDLFFDRVADALTVAAPGGNIRARLSGTLEFERYDFQLPAPGLIETTRDHLFVPRLSVFVDAQFGQRLYAFVQVRADRGFDPGHRPSEVRLDEYALRYTPWKNGVFNVQAGRFATVVGNWTNRHLGWSNPLISAPLPYDYLTGIWDTDAVRSSLELLQWSHVEPGLSRGATAREKSLRVPILWGPSYVPGVAVSGDVGRLRYAAEVKFGSLSSRPEAWGHPREQRHHPTFSGRIGYRPNPTWDIGVSASGGSYLREFAARSVPAGYGRGDYRQLVIAQDIAFAWHHLQVWTEIFATRFEVPRVGDADTVAYYAEAKYKFTPRWFGAVRWNQQLFASIPDRGARTKWGHDVWRIDLAPGFRLTPHVQAKVQYSLQHGDSGQRDTTRTIASQFIVRF